MPPPLLQLLLYDNRFNESAPLKPTDLLYRSASRAGIPYRVGSLVPASERAWQAGDREQWLLDVLPTVSAKMVMLLDATDAVLFCEAEEILDKWRRLGIGESGKGAAMAARRGRASQRGNADASSRGGGGHVLVAVEQQLWPEEQYYMTAADRKASYPQPPMGHSLLRRGIKLTRGTPLKYINIGMLAGAPGDVHALLRCMQERYPGFPRRCPGGRMANGTYEWNSDAPHKTRFGIFSGHWGWEQSCFHNYLYEQTYDDEMSRSSRCPKLVLDYRGEVILTLKKFIELLVLPWGVPGGRPHLNVTMVPALADVKPCVVHANSATKAAMPLLQLFWERMAGATRPITGGGTGGDGVGISSNPPGPSEAELTEAVQHWSAALRDKSMYPCIILGFASGLTEKEATRACTKRKPRRTAG